MTKSETELLALVTIMAKCLTTEQLAEAIAAWQIQIKKETK